MGRKRHVVVDTLGMILGVEITPANISDLAGAQQLLPRVLLQFGWLRHIWADAGYTGPRLPEVFRSVVPSRGARIEIVKRSDRSRPGFVVQPKRWIVERTFAWLSSNRRLAKDFEANPSHSAAMVLIASARLMLRRAFR
jgi:putative transposase